MIDPRIFCVAPDFLSAFTKVTSIGLLGSSLEQGDLSKAGQNFDLLI